MSTSGNQGPQAVREFEAIFTKFEARLNESRDISDGLYTKAKTLQDFQLQCDMEKDEARLKAPEGIITELNSVIERLDFINRRNTEILKHLNAII